MPQEFRFQLAKLWKVWTESPWRNFVKVYCIVTVKEQVEGGGDALKRVQALPSLRTSFWLLEEETQQKVFKLYPGSKVPLSLLVFPPPQEFWDLATG